MWVDWEDSYLDGNYGVRSAEEIGRHLGRTKNQVIGRANRLGLSSNYRGVRFKRQRRATYKSASRGWIARQASAFLQWRKAHQETARRGA